VDAARCCASTRLTRRVSTIQSSLEALLPAPVPAAARARSLTCPRGQSRTRTLTCPRGQPTTDARTCPRGQPGASVAPVPADSPAAIPAWERPDAQAPIDALLTAALTIDGALGAALAVWELGHALGVQAAEGPLGLAGMQAALAGNCRVMRAMMATMTRLGRRPEVHDVLITLDDQLHVLVPLPRHDGLFVHLVLARSRTNLALARLQARRLVAEFALAPQ
jgi:hypothetical protein